MLEIIVLTLVIIIAFIAASWYAHQRSQERARAFERELDIDEAHDEDSFQQRFDALFEHELRESGDDVAEQDKEKLTDRPDSAPDLFDEPPSGTESANADAGTDGEAEADNKADWDMVIAFTIMANEGKAFVGRAVKAALDQNDLHFGEMQIYHKYAAGSSKKTLFSVANILDPGTLLPDKFVSMTTPGLLIFARLPAPVSGLALFDELLETARSINDQLGGILCDETRQPITDEMLETMRSRILDYQMSVQTESNQFSNDYYS